MSKVKELQQNELGKYMFNFYLHSNETPFTHWKVSTSS